MDELNKTNVCARRKKNEKNRIGNLSLLEFELGERVSERSLLFLYFFLFGRVPPQCVGVRFVLYKVYIYIYNIRVGLKRSKRRQRTDPRLSFCVSFQVISLKRLYYKRSVRY